MRDATGGVTRGDVQQYNRPWWHFIDEPIFLNDAGAREAVLGVKVNLRRDVPEERDDLNMNIIQAVKNSSRIVADPTAKRELKSVHLCWLLHLVGDAHQPLHSSAIHEHAVSRRRPRRQLSEHRARLQVARLLGRAGLDRGTVRNGPRRWPVASPRTPSWRRRASSVRRRSIPARGSTKGHVLAKKFVYTPEVLAKIAAREGHSHLRRARVAGELLRRKPKRSPSGRQWWQGIAWRSCWKKSSIERRACPLVADATRCRPLSALAMAVTMKR